MMARCEEWRYISDQLLGGSGTAYGYYVIKSATAGRSLGLGPFITNCGPSSVSGMMLRLCIIMCVGNPGCHSSYVLKCLEALYRITT